MGKGTELAIAKKEALERVREARIQAVREELAILRVEMRKVEKDLEKAKSLASPPWFKIDEIKRGSREHLERKPQARSP